MALEYDLDIATNCESHEITRLIAGALGFEYDGGTDLSISELNISVIRKSERGQETMREAYGFQPTINVGFRLRFSDSYKDTKKHIAEATVALLPYSHQGAVLLYNGEQTVLRYFDGELLLNEGWGEWLKPELATAKMAYKECALASPLIA